MLSLVIALEGLRGKLNIIIPCNNDIERSLLSDKLNNPSNDVGNEILINKVSSNIIYYRSLNFQSARKIQI